MRFALPTLIAAIVVVNLPVEVSARRGPKRLRPPSRTKVPQPAQGSKAHNQEVEKCKSMQAVLMDGKNRLDEYKAEQVGVDSELRSLEQRIRELRSRQSYLRTYISKLERGIVQREDQYRATCAASETCSQYERLADGLQDRRKPLDALLVEIRDDISRTRTDLVTLGQRIKPLRSEYHDKRCNNLIPGETSQSTINRCMAIFSEWNRLQGDLNRQNEKLPALKRRYDHLSQKMEAVARQAGDYETYLTKNCRGSSKIRLVQDYRVSKDRARHVADDLDKLIRDLTALRGIKITVE